MHKSLTVLSFIFIYTTLLNSQNVINVPDDYQTIQEALDAADSRDTILISPGKYFENISWPKADSLVMIGVEGSNQTIVDGSNNGAVIVQGYLGNCLTIKGLTIQNGRTNRAGAGLVIFSNNVDLSDLKVKNNIIIDDENNNRRGAGINLEGSSGSISNSEITGNKILNSSTPGGVTNGTRLPSGAGMNLYIRDQKGSNHEFEINNVIFSNNSAGIECEGGGLHIEGLEIGSVLNINKCIFENNRSPIGSAIYASTINGGAESRLNLTIKNTEILKNKVISSVGDSGNAIYLRGSCRYLNLQNCLIANNEGYALENDALVWQVEPLNTFQLNHCTLVYNEKGIFSRSSVYDIKNSIFWNNDILEIEDVSGVTNPSSYEVSHCLIKGGFNMGSNIIVEEPKFISQDIFVPSEDSPCLNAGISTNLDTDLIGFPRPIPIGSYADIGAYEANQYFAHFISKFYYDINRNGIRDADEIFIALGAVKINNDIVLRNFREAGVLYVIEQGIHTVKFSMDSNANWELTSSEESFTLDVNVDDYSRTLEFGVAPINNFSKLSPIITSDRFRCGEEVEMKLCLNNSGTEIENGILWLSFDPRFENFSFDVDPEVIDNNHLVGWQYEDLYPQQSICYDFKVTAPLIIDASQIGEIYCLYASSDDQNEFGIDNAFKLDLELRCAFDPNDKAVFPSRKDSLVLKDNPLLYRIRFQNTGNDFARNLNIMDTLNENLDVTTFRLINTSHPDQLNIIFESSHIVKFDFPNIYLPDSTTTLIGSNGFVNYRIEPKSETDNYSELENTAYINFDFNPSIQTNTTKSIVVDQFPISNTLENEKKQSIHMFPNPSSGKVYFDEKVDRIRVININGQLLLTEIDVNELNLSLLKEDIYLIEIISSNHREIHKLVIIK